MMSKFDRLEKKNLRTLLLKIIVFLNVNNEWNTWKFVLGERI